MQARFFVLMTVGNQPGQQMDDKIGGTAMTRMLNLRNVLELVNDRLDDRPFAQQLIGKVHEMVLHVFAQPGDKLKSLFKEQFGQGNGNGAAIPKELATKSFDQLGNRRPIIDIARCQTTGQQAAPVIDRQMQLEAKEPAHRSLAPPGIGGKDPMLTDPFGVTDLQGGGIDKTDPGAGSKSALPVGQQRNQHPGNERDKASVTDQVRKFCGQMHLHMFRIVRLEGAIVGLVKMHENGHHLAGT